jgi:hypothetical protein
VLEKNCDEICDTVRCHKCSGNFSRKCVLDLKIGKLWELERD